tara:strand:- start:872 stop:1540 length:669 start_codon:yes stop_codon:yes gene_type:complete
MNKNILLIIITINFLLFGSNDPNQDLLNYLKEDKNWVLIDNKSGDLRVFEKDIPKMNLNALKVEKIVEIDPNKILKVVMDIENYSEVMDNEAMISYLIGKKNNNIYAYNKFSIPLPFIRNRHYFFKIKQISKDEINWTLVGDDEVKASPGLSKILNNNDDAVYMNYGAGLWRVDKISDNLSKVSYSLYMDSGGSLSNHLNDLLTSQSIVLLFNGVLKKSRSL